MESEGASYAAQAAAWAVVAAGVAGAIKSAVSVSEDTDTAAAAETAAAAAETAAIATAESAAEAADTRTAIVWTVITDADGNRSLEPVFAGAATGLSWEPDAATTAAYTADTTDYAALLDWTGENDAATKQAVDTANGSAGTAEAAASAAASSAARAAAASGTASGTAGAVPVSDALNGITYTKDYVNQNLNIAAGMADYTAHTASALPAGSSPWAGDYSPLPAGESSLWGGSGGAVTALADPGIMVTDADPETGLWGGAAGSLTAALQQLFSDSAAAESGDTAEALQTPAQRQYAFGAGDGLGQAILSAVLQAAGTAEDAAGQTAVDPAGELPAETAAGQVSAETAVEAAETTVLSAEFSAASSAAIEAVPEAADMAEVWQTETGSALSGPAQTEAGLPPAAVRTILQAAPVLPGEQQAEGSLPPAEVKAVLQAATDTGGAAGTVEPARSRQPAGAEAPGSAAARRGRGELAAGAETGAGLEAVLAGLTRQFAQRLAISGEGVHR